MRRSKSLLQLYRYFLCFSLIAFLFQTGVFGQPVTIAEASSAPTWVSLSDITGNRLQGVRYGGGEWLALGISDTIATSADGKSWTTFYPASATDEWADALYDGSRWILVGDKKLYGSTGSTASTDSGWVSLKAATVSLWGIAYDNNTYVVVGDNGTILTSTNGTDWDSQTLPGESGESLTAVTYAAGTFVAVSTSGNIYASQNGTTWTKAYTAAGFLASVCYGNNQFVAVGGAGEAYHSADGTAWSASPMTVNEYYSVDYGNEKFVAVGKGGKLLTSPDARTWTAGESANTTEDLYGVRYSPEQSRFVIVGDNGLVRTQSNKSDLDNMTLSAGTLNPAFTQATKAYTATVDMAVTQTTVTMTPADSDATILVNGANATVTGGTATSTVNLNPGSNTAMINVTSQDGTKQTDYTLTITRALPNLPPTDISIDNDRLAENQSAGTLIGTLSATDVDSTTFTYSLVDGFGDNASFAIVDNQLKSGVVFDYEAKNSYSVKIRVTDSSGGSYEKVFTIQVTDVQEAPTVSDSGKNGTEDNSLQLAEADFTSAYADPENDSLKKVQIISLPGAASGTLKLNGAAVTANQEVDAADLGKLVFEPAANWNGTTSFTWKGNDGHFYSDTAATFTMTIAAVNDLPIVTNSTVHGTEDTDVVFRVTDFSSQFTDVDGDALANIEIISLPEAAKGSLTLAGTPVTVNQVIDAGTLNQLRFTPIAGWSGTTSFQWKGSDGTGYSQTAATLTLNIAAINHPPTVTDSSKNGTEDTELSFVATDFEQQYHDADLNPLASIQIVTLPTNGMLKLDGTAVSANQSIAASQLGQLRFVPDANWYGSTSFTWKGYDGTTYSSSAANVTINIAAVNDPPTVADSSKNGLEDTVVSFTAADFISVYHDVENDSMQKVQIVSLPAHGTLLLNNAPVSAGQQIDANDLGGLTFSPARDWNGTTSFKWNGYDGSVYATQAAEMSIVIAPVDDVPTVSDSSKNGTEGYLLTFAASDFTAHFTDVDGDALQSIRIESLPTSGTLKLDGTAVSLNDEIDAADLRKLTFMPVRSGTASFMWKGSDGNNYSVDAATLTLRIAPVIIITPTPSSDATLSNLRISEGTLEPDFRANQLEYSTEVDQDVKEITVTPIAAHWAATIRVNDEIVASGQSSKAIALKDGSAKVKIVVTAQDGSTSNTYVINVGESDEPITDIRLDKRTATLKEGDRPLQLKASVEPTNASTKGLVWTSSKPKVASVDETGKVIPLSVGTTTIRVATADGKISATTRVTVKAGKIQELRAKPQLLVLGKGESGSVDIQAFYGYETVKDITDGISWSSEDEQIATVSEDGEIKAEAPGTTFVTAAYKGKKIAVMVKVIPFKWVDETEVEASFDPPANGSTRYRLKASGTLLTKESVTVQVKFGSKKYTATVGKDLHFSLDRAMTWKDELPEQVDIIIKSKKGGKEQIVTVPLRAFDPELIEVAKNGKGKYTITGDLLQPDLVAKVEATDEDGEHYSGKIEDEQFAISLKGESGQTVNVRVVLYSGFEQELEVELP